MGSSEKKVHFSFGIILLTKSKTKNTAPGPKRIKNSDASGLGREHQVGPGQRGGLRRRSARTGRLRHVGVLSDLEFLKREVGNADCYVKSLIFACCN